MWYVIGDSKEDLNLKYENEAEPVARNKPLCVGKLYTPSIES